MANADGGELNAWLAGQWVCKEGEKRWTVYYPGDRLMTQSHYASDQPESGA